MKLNSGPSVRMFIFIFVIFVFMLAYSCVLFRNIFVCLCARVCFMCNPKLAGCCRFGGEASYGRRGLRLVRFMLNSVSISWLLPSLQQKAKGETQAHRNPLALTGAVFNHLSQGPGPQSTVNKHSIEIISSLFCSLIFVLSLFPSASVSLCFTCS